MKVSPEIAKLIPYSPGKSIEETKRELGLSQVFKLASNENPLPPSPKVVEAVQQAVLNINRYPDAGCYELRQAVAQHYQVEPEWLSFGNGSNELIDLLIRIFCEPGDSILTSEAGFVAYRICAQAARVKTIETPLTQELKFDLTALKQKALAEKPKLIFIANPNNPTGTYVSRPELDEFMADLGGRDDVLVVFDEAYLEFVRADDYADAIEYLRQYENVVVLRTMSKVYGLAGLRVGSVVARPEIIDYVNRVRNPFNVNSLAQVAVKTALEDRDYLKKVQDLTWSGLDYMYKELETLKLPFWRSQTNFVLFDSLRDSSEVFQALLKKGVIMRPVKNYGLNTHIRLSVGLPEENEAAMTALGQVLSEIPEQK